MLLSARNTWTLYDVDLHSGGFRWRLGGDHSQLPARPACRFYWQHDAEFQPGGLISVFDNGSDPPKEKQSRGLLLRPDTATPHGHAREGIHQPHARRCWPKARATRSACPAANWLLGYGGLPNFTEFDACGHVLLDATLGKNVQNFRTYLAPWSAPADGGALDRRAEAGSGGG